jgi:hypothetical protein
MGEVDTCRREGCGRPGPLREDGFCSETCAQEHTLLERIRAGIAAREAWIREQLAGLSPEAAAERLGEILRTEEAIELAGGYRHLTVVHGYLERDKDWELLERLLDAMRAACAGRDAHHSSQKHRLTLTVGPPDADLVVGRLATLARKLAAEAAADGGWRWQVAQLKYPRERWW